MVKRLQKVRLFDAATFFTIITSDLESLSVCTDRLTLGYASERFKNRILKKYCPTGTRNPEADRSAVDKFLAVNANQLPVTLSGELLGEARDFIYTVLERGTKVFGEAVGADLVPQQSLDFLTVFSRWKIGSGASNGAEGPHFCEKMTGKLSTSNNASRYLGVLAHVSPTVFTRTTNEARTLVEVSKVRGSKGSTVPKTPEISRFIASEPVVNMCDQLAAANFIIDSLSLFGYHIDLQQDRNKRLAELGSIRGDGIGLRFCTLDLESASDRITPALVKLLFPPEWYHFLMDIRSESCSVPGVGEVELSMIGTMGNGFTFALMTFILTSLVYALQRVYQDSKRNAIDWTKVGVYGDDIIVDTTLALPLVSALTSCGLVVNHNKSYDTGYFRESCGGDYFNGYDVTPVYIKSLVSRAERIIALNQLLGWCRKHKVWLTAIDYLLGSLDKRDLNLVPMYEDDYAGVKSPLYRPTYVATRKFMEPTIYNGDIPLACALGGYVSTKPCVSLRSEIIDDYEVVTEIEDSGFSKELYFTKRDAKVKYFRTEVPSVTTWAGADHLKGPWEWESYLAAMVSC